MEFLNLDEETKKPFLDYFKYKNKQDRKIELQKIPQLT
jgi:hypothetical protein